jgi:large subunit ribosomal protein L15
MKLHDLRPAAGSHTKKTRVGRGIAAGKGKTAGRGTKGQKSRAGAAIPAWFEGGQTPLHIRIPKLRGFRNINRIEYEVVNIGRISAAVEAGRLPEGEKGGPITVNQDLLRLAGLVRSLDKPMKILGGGEVSQPLFVVADAFTASARAKIEAAGGTVQVLEIPTGPLAALGVDAGPVDEPAEVATADEPAKPERAAKAAKVAKADGAAPADEPAAADVADEPAPADEPAAADEA